jgi:integrase
MKVQLTDRFCQHAKSTRAQTDYFDETVRGLALRVTSRGTKAWTFLYGTPRRRVTLGRYPSLSLAGARTLALETREGLTAGTVSALAEAYVKSVQGNRTAKEIERRLRKDALPIIGHIPIRELHRRDLARVIDAKSAPISARRVFEDLRAMVRWAVARGDLDHNPIDGVKGPPISKPRERVLTDDEIRILWNSLPQLRSVACQQIIKLCLLIGQRLGEVAGLRKSELDLPKAVWNIPGSRTKNGHSHSVPLSEMALGIIEDAIGDRDEVFDPSWADRMCQVIGRTQFGLAHWTAHDLRRTALTKMAELGVAPIVIGHVANHRTTTKAGITLGVYVQHAYEREKREALELWADRLTAIVGGNIAKVLPLRGA